MSRWLEGRRPDAAIDDSKRQAAWVARCDGRGLIDVGYRSITVIDAAALVARAGRQTAART